MDVRVRTDPRLLGLAFMVAVWIAATWFLFAWYGGFRGTTAGGQMTGGFVVSSPILWIEHVSLLALALLAFIRQRSDVMGLLLLGPAISFGLIIVGERWIDPTWPERIVQCYSIGWLMSLIAAAEYSILFPESAWAD